MTKKLDPRDYIVTADADVRTIDLDHEEFTLRDGRRLTDDLAEQLASQAQAEIGRRNLIPGRKSLSGGGQHSPTIRVRVPEQLHKSAEQLAAAEGVSLSKLTRAALESYLARPEANRAAIELLLEVGTSAASIAGRLGIAVTRVEAIESAIKARAGS